MAAREDLYALTDYGPEKNNCRFRLLPANRICLLGLFTCHSEKMSPIYTYNNHLIKGFCIANCYEYMLFW